MKQLLKRILAPARRLAGRFVILPHAADPVRNMAPIHLAANFVCAEEVPGDYLEFGVFRGASFTIAYRAITEAIEDWSSRKRAYLAYTDRQRAEEAFQRVRDNLSAWSEKRFFAFDSFDGLPETMGIDALSARFARGRYDCSQDEFMRILKKQGVDLSRVIAVPGFYEKSLKGEVKDRYRLSTASIVMVDCDLYSSTKTVLDFVTDLVVEGTILIFDDWFSFRANPNLGEQRACREWLEENPHLSLMPYARWGITPQSFIVHLAGHE